MMVTKTKTSEWYFRWTSPVGFYVFPEQFLRDTDQSIIAENGGACDDSRGMMTFLMMPRAVLPSLWCSRAALGALGALPAGAGRNNRRGGYAQKHSKSTTSSRRHASYNQQGRANFTPQVHNNNWMAMPLECQFRTSQQQNIVIKKHTGSVPFFPFSHPCRLHVANKTASRAFEQAETNSPLNDNFFVK